MLRKKGGKEVLWKMRNSNKKYVGEISKIYAVVFRFNLTWQCIYIRRIWKKLVAVEIKMLFLNFIKSLHKNLERPLDSFCFSQYFKAFLAFHSLALMTTCVASKKWARFFSSYDDMRG